MNDYGFDLLDLSPKGINDISKLLTLVFGNTSQLTPDFIDWEYNKNPGGKAVGYNAYYDNVLAGHYVAQPIISKVDGKEVKGLLSLNTATHPDHRGKRLFTILADKTYNYAKEQGFKFVIGVANANSTPGFLKRLDFKLIKPLDVKFGVGKFPVSIKENDEYRRYWNKEQLEWRLDNPKSKYRIAIHKDHFLVYAPTGNYGIMAIIGYFPISLLPDKLPENASVSANPAKIWLGMDNGLSWKGNLFFNLPDRLKPSPLNLIYRNLEDDTKTLNPDGLKFMCIDFDAY